MAALASSLDPAGPIYIVVDAEGRNITLVVGQPVIRRPVTPQMRGNPTVEMSTSSFTVRMTQANAAGWPYLPGQQFTDADNNTVSFAASVPIYSGGGMRSANLGGEQMLFRGLVCHLTAANLTDLGVPLAAFAAAPPTSFASVPVTGAGGFTIDPYTSGLSHAVTLTASQMMTNCTAPDVGAKTISLPGASPANLGFVWVLKLTRADGTAYTVTPSTGTIEGAASYAISDVVAPAVWFGSDGVSNWALIS